MDAHEDLLDGWSRRRHHQGQRFGFIKDGIIDNDRWRSADPKVLFLLKEARHGGAGTWDLRKHLRESAPKTATWRNAAYWCYAIDHIKRGRLPGLPFPSERKAEYLKAVEALRCSAIINIKKSNGQSSSSHGDIEWYARKDKQFIQRQIELIAPDVVICGYTWRYVEDWWPVRPLFDGVYRTGHRVFVNFWHPSYRISEELKYYALAGQLQNSNALANLSVMAFE